MTWRCQFKPHYEKVLGNTRQFFKCFKNLRETSIEKFRNTRDVVQSCFVERQYLLFIPAKE